MLNFSWWVNRKDRFGKNVFEGGFLGLDNIGVFDRSAPLPTGGHLEQADGTSWVSLFCQNMLEISVELAAQDSFFEDMAIKFADHFLLIAHAMNRMGGTACGTKRRASVGSEEARLGASLRPPLKLYMQISCIQLSRRFSRAEMPTKELA